MSNKTLKINSSGISFLINNKLIKSPTIVDLKNVNNSELEKQLIQVGLTAKTSQGFKNVRINPTDRRLGCFKDPPDDRDYMLSNSILSRDLPNMSEVPNKVTYTSEMSKIKDQGNLGSCVAFGCMAVKEYLEQQEYLRELKEGSKYRRSKNHYNMSEQWVYRKTKEIDLWPNSEGTSIRYAMKILQKYGVPPEKGWPYNDNKKGKPKTWTEMISRWGKIRNYFRIRTLEELISCIYKFGPVPIGIVCFEEIFNPGSDGIIPYPRNLSKHYGGHCICATSYNLKTNYICFKNSWGKSWGRNGLGFLPFKYIRDFMLDAWVMVDMDVNLEELKNA